MEVHAVDVVIGGKGLLDPLVLIDDVAAGGPRVDFLEHHEVGVLFLGGEDGAVGIEFDGFLGLGFAIMAAGFVARCVIAFVHEEGVILGIGTEADVVTNCGIGFADLGLSRRGLGIDGQGLIADAVIGGDEINGIAAYR